MVDNWLARFEEGYVTVAGECVTITDRLHRDQPWESPGAALRHWESEGLAGPGVCAYGNGREQTLDVGDQNEFAAVRVQSIWRRVSFETDERPRR